MGDGRGQEAGDIIKAALTQGLQQFHWGILGKI